MHLTRLGLAEITGHRAGEGKHCLCVIRDSFSNRIAGHWISERMQSRLAVKALNDAVARRGNAAGCIVRTDPGSHFCSRKFVRALDGHDIAGSMDKAGGAGAEIVMESAFVLL
ncbi:transposase [Micrococcus sp. HSID17245]|uniref:DDE-type integrase/transposase/recombinase n=1 Tax=Micrococcus sp. HSID17245 TaxID=2419508 RepID=UPI000F885AB3|nr:DDE-type integrase/transposase/recombinase [Micrococcus sp. HSID17245]RUQ29144.1 transposase [Micrococcus sp. HSID17245]